MEKEKATIKDYARMCEFYGNCEKCPLRAPNNGENIPCGYLIREFPDKANEIILNWCKEHPVETRQDRFLKIFPNAKPLFICPATMGYETKCPSDCEKCQREYWLSEVEE